MFKLIYDTEQNISGVVYQNQNLVYNPETETFDETDSLVKLFRKWEAENNINLIEWGKKNSQPKVSKPETQKFISEPVYLTLGIPLFFHHKFIDLDLIKDTCMVSGILKCVEPEHGYEIDASVVPSAGISYELNSKEIIVRPNAKKIEVVAANNGKTNRIKVRNWQLIVEAVVL